MRNQVERRESVKCSRDKNAYHICICTDFGQCPWGNRLHIPLSTSDRIRLVKIQAEHRNLELKMSSIAKLRRNYLESVVGWSSQMIWEQILHELLFNFVRFFLIISKNFRSYSSTLLCITYKIDPSDAQVELTNRTYCFALVFNWQHEYMHWFWWTTSKYWTFY